MLVEYTQEKLEKHSFETLIEINSKIEAVALYERKMKPYQIITADIASELSKQRLINNILYIHSL